MNKKNTEKDILERFQEFTGIKFEILELNTAQQVFNNYTGENPDFIINLENNYIGVELFKLRLNRSHPPIKYAGKSYINQEHRNSEHSNTFTLSELEKQLDKEQKNPEQYPLHLQDDIYDVLKERLPEKFNGVLNHYVTNINWLIGYANEINDQVAMISGSDSLKLSNFIAKLMSEFNCGLSSRVGNIFLYEFDTTSEDYIFKYKPTITAIGEKE